ARVLEEVLGVYCITHAHGPIAWITGCFPGARCATFFAAPRAESPRRCAPLPASDHQPSHVLVPSTRLRLMASSRLGLTAAGIAPHNASGIRAGMGQRGPWPLSTTPTIQKG